jgi:endonuclease III
VSDDERLYKQLDRIEERLDGSEKILERNTLSLEEHIKRTNLLEEEFKPVKRHVEFMNAVAKVVSVAAGAAMMAKGLGLF